VEGAVPALAQIRDGLPASAKNRELVSLSGSAGEDADAAGALGQDAQLQKLRQVSARVASQPASLFQAFAGA
jgi:hypothetical protein